MDFRYGIINECLFLVRESKMATKSKLFMETLLYQMKRLLLKHDRHKSAVGATDLADLKEYEELRSQLLVFYADSCGADFLDDIADRLNGMLTILSRDFIAPDHYGTCKIDVCLTRSDAWPAGKRCSTCQRKSPAAAFR